MTKRFGGALAASLASFALSSQLLTGQVVKPSQPDPDMHQELGVSILMRDGVRLAADVFYPPGGGRWPTLLIRTPYNRKSAAMASYRFFARRGYAVVIEDTRGRYASQGTFGEIGREGPDGNDSINWSATQPWSNGRVGMAGSSYLGIVQWWAAIQDNPHLFTICPVNSGDDEYLDRFYSTGGALKLGHRLLWLAENFTPPSKVRPSFGSYIFHLPLRTADTATIGDVSPLWRNALSHPSYDSFWKNQSIRNNLPRVGVPVQSMSGWFDNYAESELDAFKTLSHRGDVVETWIGPWAHDPGQSFRTRDFGPEADVHIRARQADWFDRWLKKQAPQRTHAGGALHLFVMGPNVWRSEREWPLARTRYTPFYLGSDGHANSAAGNGILRWLPVRNSQVDQFTYDPKKPVPTIGGAICCNPKVLPPGPLDQSPVEGRPDVLVYTSTPLAQDVEVTGPVRVVLYMSTSVNDTDFTAKLVDVQPDGTPLLVCDGIQRLRYRLSLEKPVFVKRNAVYQISIDAGVTSYVFAPHHRMRLEISSSNFPKFDRNLNSVKPNADETKTAKAHQTIYHELGYPSAIILPLIPKSREGRLEGSSPAKASLNRVRP